MLKVVSVLKALETAVAYVGAAFLFIIMVIVAADVFMRYVAGSPFSFTYDLVGVYLMVGVFYLVLPHAQGARANVAVDILVSAAPPFVQRLSDIVTSLAGGSVFALIAVVGYQRAFDAYQSNDVLAGLIPWPVWLSAAMVPLGAGMLVLRFALTACGHIASLVSGRNLTSLPSHTGDATSEVFE